MFLLYRTMISTLRDGKVNLGMVLLFDEENGDKFPMAALAAVWVLAAIVAHRTSASGAGGVEAAAEAEFVADARRDG